MRKYIPNSILRQLIFLLLSLALLFLVLYHLSAFLPGFLGAFCLYVLLIHPLRWMMYKWKMKRIWSVILLMLGSILVIVTPIYFLIDMLTNRVSDALANKDKIQAQIELGLQKVHEEFGVDVLKEINLGDVSAVIVKVVQEILNTSINGLLQLGVAYLIVYFMLMNYRKMENWFYDNIPLKTENLVILNKDLRDLVISNAVGVPVVAVLQAVVAYIGYLIFGLDQAFSWFIVTIFGAMVPVVGAAIIYIPAVIYLLASGETTNAYLLLAYSLIVVGASDNIFRFWTQKVMADVHPLITIFGVIVGVNIFGFIGIIFGPIVLSLVIWSFRIYKLEFSGNTQKDELAKEQL
ncbi:putative PurR-regulated permease PerM [Moheibacter stercoris]|uniref:PurR-regulated permease PerM n=2 Tax=Moheibacter stercoris TaxID=1628251 RepID=A0ABV2LWM7_9FLAO